MGANVRKRAGAPPKPRKRSTVIKLVGGPYRAPQCEIGGTLRCLLRGRVQVEGLTRARIPWPYVSAPAGRRSLVLCGDLAKALETESALAVMHCWGVSRPWATRARRALGIGRWTEGTRQLWSQLWDRRLGVEAARKGGLATAGIPRTSRSPAKPGPSDPEL